MIRMPLGQRQIINLDNQKIVEQGTENREVACQCVREREMVSVG